MVAGAKQRDKIQERTLRCYWNLSGADLALGASSISALEFWNWPELSVAFLQEIVGMVGGRVQLVRVSL
jgi:hypothetical protein